MINILLSGCNGAMGNVLKQVISEEADIQIVAGCDRESRGDSPFPIYTNIEDVTEQIDVLIDFSHFSAFESVLTYALRVKLPLVMATTGLTEKDEEALVEASKTIPVFRTANMSIGVNVLLDVVSQLAKKLDDFDIELIEKHHNKKVDAPSGTALMLAKEIDNALDHTLQFTFGREGNAAKRKANELGIHAIRGGTIAGEHTVIFAGEDELIEVKHSASSKKVFAKGAIKAAKYLVKKENGYYDMREVLKSQ